MSDKNQALAEVLDEDEKIDEVYEVNGSDDDQEANGEYDFEDTYTSLEEESLGSDDMKEEMKTDAEATSLTESNEHEHDAIQQHFPTPYFQYIPQPQEDQPAIYEYIQNDEVWL